MRNILLITADQFRYDMLGHLGKHPVETPNLDQLAGKGLRFDNAYCPYPLCVPTRASIMTGLRPCDHGVYYNDQGWAGGLPTIAGRLAENGYYTTEVGKTHFLPRRRHGGFQRLWETDLAYIKELHARGLSRFDARARRGKYGSAFKTTPTHLPDEMYPSIRTTDLALEELRVIADRRRCRQFGYEAFFMWLSYFNPHTPCDPPEPYFSMYDRNKLTPFVRSESELAGFSKPLLRSRDEWRFMDDAHMAKLRAQYMGDVTLIDHQIGRVLAALNEMGLRGNTLIVFSADHGDYLGDHWLQQKGFFHEPSARVPLIFNGPDVAPGRTCREPVSVLDLYPTLLDYEDVWMPTLRDPGGRLVYQNAEDMPGRSLLGALTGKEALDPERVVVSESAIYGRHLMIRYRNLKYNHYFDSGEWDVFDLEKDPHEFKNLKAEMRLADLPAPMQAAFKEVDEKMLKWKDGFYHFKGKLRPMFT